MSTKVIFDPNLDLTSDELKKVKLLNENRKYTEKQKLSIKVDNDIYQFLDPEVPNDKKPELSLYLKKKIMGNKKTERIYKWSNKSVFKKIILVKDVAIPINTDENTNKKLKEVIEKGNFKQIEEFYKIESEKSEKWVQLIKPEDRIEMIYKCHKQLNHKGIKKVIDVLQEKFYFWGIQEETEYVLKSCSTCILNGTTKKTRAKSINPVVINQVNRKWSIDLFFLDGNIFLSVIDHASRKAAGRGPLSSKSSKSVAEAFESICKL